MKAIAAMSLNRVIGCSGQIPWHLPDDFKWFKKTTLGKVVVMGRKTFESLGKPLPGRTNVVVSRRGGICAPGIQTVSDLVTFDPAVYAEEVFIIGGAEIYTRLLPACSDLYLSVVKREVEGDVFFPEFESGFKRMGVLLEHEDFEVVHYRNRN